MSVSNRQNSLLANQDWSRIYQTFRNADFTSYDFETLRKSMVDYLRLFYPEDFNDYIESSEYIALIDLIAFLGQSLAFRIDLNARENFMDTAERRDSILKLARLISYKPKRNIASRGLLKVTSISTTESVTDSNGVNIANLPISWNDVTNGNWQEQFSIILNAALINSQTIGNPGNSQVINSIKNDEYTINITSKTIPTYPFSASVQNTGMRFEVVSATSVGEPYIYEVDPKPTSLFTLLFRNDNQGNGSVNTGFFTYFTQGSIQSIDFNVPDATPNRVLSVGTSNINNTDVWLYDLDVNLVEKNLWTSVPAVGGVNVIYNNLPNRNLYEIDTTAGDQINLVFGDGSFANIPQGNFRLYFRTSNALTYKITPDEIQNVAVPIRYISRTGNTESLTLYLTLTSTVSNATASETIDSIRQKAPQQYYTQNRMITGEDYNIVPFTSFSDIILVRALNRTSSGVSRFLDVSDASGKFSSTNIFAQDGYVFSQNILQSLIYSFQNTSNVNQMIQDELTTILNSYELMQFYYANTARYNVANATWHLSSYITNSATGYFYNSSTKQVMALGYNTGSTAKYINTSCLVKFAATIDPINAPAYFDAQNNIQQGVPHYAGDKLYLYSTVMQIQGDGTNAGIGNFINGQGPVTLSTNVPTGAVIADSGIIPSFNNSLPATLISTIAAGVLAYNTFALRYDITTLQWQLVTAADISTAVYSPSLNAGNITGTGQDNSWLIKFQWTPGLGYEISWRSLSYIFGSTAETTFYFDNNVKVYDNSTGTTIQDSITVLGINPNPDSAYPLGVDHVWKVYKNLVGTDGFEDQSKVYITFADENNDGVPDNPDLFANIVSPLSPPLARKLMFFKQNTTYGGFLSYIPIDTNLVNVEYPNKQQILLNLQLYKSGQVFFTTGELLFYQLTINEKGKYLLAQVTNYIVEYGRQNLKFQYRHNSPNYRRIDPSPNNIIDLYLLTNAYARDYMAWIQDTTGVIKQPLAPTTDELTQAYGTLNKTKAISDTLIFNSAVFKPLFGSIANPSLQANFKVVKNANLNVSDNDIKISVVNALNSYFAIGNWDFGETFYFSELSAYLHTTLSPNISSVVIVATASNALFGSLYQVNAESSEIIVSCATVDNVEIISAITATAINASIAGLNNSVVLGTII